MRSRPNPFRLDSLPFGPTTANEALPAAMVRIEAVITSRGSQPGMRWEYCEELRTFTKWWDQVYEDWWQNPTNGAWHWVRWTLHFEMLEGVVEDGVAKVKEVWTWQYADVEEVS